MLIKETGVPLSLIKLTHKTMELTPNNRRLSDFFKFTSEHSKGYSLQMAVVNAYKVIICWSFSFWAEASKDLTVGEMIDSIS
mmetsp:Transcript_23789/g.36480  ORF Transcript_23789/g.36480 Transcript_23789/m.36480 type:complete len:82 (+) Transcript_23789:159-404(+)